MNIEFEGINLRKPEFPTIDEMFLTIVGIFTQSFGKSDRLLKINCKNYLQLIKKDRCIFLFPSKNISEGLVSFFNNLC